MKELANKQESGGLSERPPEVSPMKRLELANGRPSRLSGRNTKNYDYYFKRSTSCGQLLALRVTPVAHQPAYHSLHLLLLRIRD